MFATAAMIAVVAFGAADLHAATPTFDPMPSFQIDGAPSAPPTAVDARLHSALLEAPATGAAAWTLDQSMAFGGQDAPLAHGVLRPDAATPFAQQHPATPPPPAAATPPPPTATPAPTPPAAAADAGGYTEDDLREERERAMLRARRQISYVHRALGIATWTALAGTMILGTIDAVNQPTVFGTGLCQSTSSAPIFDNFGCNGLSTLHEISAFVTVGLYASTGIYSLNMLRLDRLSGPAGRSSTALTIHKTMAYIHLVGMLLEPILGVIGYDPQVIGLPTPTTAASAASQMQFQADIRTIHMFVGYITFAALTTAMAVELSY